MTSFIHAHKVQISYRGAVYSSVLGLIVNDKGFPSFIGLQESVDVYKIVHGKESSMGSVPDDDFNNIIRLMTLRYMKTYTEECTANGISLLP